MDIQKFVSNFKNHPVMFVGNGLSLRYLEHSYSWNNLLSKIALDINENSEYYLDLKTDSMVDGICQYEKVATILESDFNSFLKENSYGKFEKINNEFYKKMSHGISVSQFKIYISDLLKEINLKDSVLNEVAELKKARKNIGSVVTTNYIYILTLRILF